MTEPSAPAPHGGPGPFDLEIDRRSIVKTGVWLGAITLGAFLIGWLFYERLASAELQLDPKPSPLVGVAAPSVPPAPRLQRTPERELGAFRAAERERLASWGWVDRGAGVARIPIERAIDSVAESGRLPDFSAAPAEAPQP
jgi:hypothetical protein